jgi:orotate phosphoribosyltransferase
MQPYKEHFVRFLVEAGALKFGDFTLKSGRKSPYFVNLGGFCDGTALRQMGGFYAHRVVEAFGDGFNLLFGPAYKGIPLAVACAVALDEGFGRCVPFAFNRKEAKDHGDAGLFVGRAPRDGDRVVILDDVFTTGETKEEAVALLRRAGAAPVGVVIAVDRGEVGAGGDSAIDAFRRDFGVPVHSIVDIREIIEGLHGREVAGRVVVDDRVRREVEEYLSRWGAPGFRPGATA